MTQSAVVLAAGKGTRMKSELAKVLHPVAGQPMLAHVLRALQAIETDRTVVVVGHQAEAVRSICDGFGVDTVLQSEQLGTGHAVEQARALLAPLAGHTLILCGDVPLLASATMRRLRDATVQAQAAGAVLTAIATDPTGYGRILRDDERRVVAIVEHKDASEEQRRIREYNTGTYCFRSDLLWSSLSSVGRDNAQGEYYLTDVVGILVAQGHSILGVVCPDEREVQGVNTLQDLERVNADFEAMYR
jgi:bifunctional UDP-N-acetylglucosamine pyrophosphorylase/glucosamine-1-phosphate N-acetyltransferase